MAVIAVMNRKGGSGKSTLATHIAAYLAAGGHEVMLGDVDKQQSSRLWLSLRPTSRPHIHGWTIDDRNFARPPAGVKHVVLDTPGGFQGIGLMRVALYADAILIPATGSLFDRTAAADCLAELRTQPRVSGGRCQLACVGMRIDSRTRQAVELKGWAESQGIHHLGAIRSVQAYNRLLDQGLSLFDLEPERVAAYIDDWKPVTAWLDAVLAARTTPDAGTESGRAEARAEMRNASRPIIPSVLRRDAE